MKYCWIDCETTGLDPKKHGLIQLAWIIENEKGEVLSEKELKIQPFKTDTINPEALEINNIDILDLEDFMNPIDAYFEFIKQVGAFACDETGKKELLTMCGHNVKFDYEFLKEWFHKVGAVLEDDVILRDETVGLNSLFNFYLVDTMYTANFLAYCGVPFEKRSLSELCTLFNIELNPHNALSDARASRELGHKFKDAFLRK